MLDNEKILDFIREKDLSKLDLLLEESHPVDIASVIEDEELSTDDIIYIFEAKDKEVLARILEACDEEVQANIVGILDYPNIIKIFSYMSKDDIVDILGNLAINSRKRLLNLMKVSDSKEISMLLGYDTDTAGGIMTTEYIALYENMSISEALGKIKEIAPKTEVIDTVFVLNRNKVLVGLADLRDILVAPYDETLKDIMDENFISVNAEDDQEEVFLQARKYALSVVPVVNRKNALLGIITVDDIMEVMVEEHSEDLLKMGGIGDNVEEIGGKVNLSIKRRLPWLVVNLVTAIFATMAISLFDSTIAEVAALAAIMTIVSGMGGNAGSQTLSLAIRGISLGEISLKDDWALVFKEISVGLINGSLIGIIAAIYTYVRYGNIYLSFIVIMALTINLIVAGISGYIIPLLLKGLGFDPALSSSIFLTTVTDTGGFFVFLGLATLFINYIR